MKKLFDKKIPTILGIILISLGIFLTTFITKDQTIFNSKASNSAEPKNIKMTNISDQAFTITYQTGMPTTGSISYGYDKKLGESGLEDVDKEKGSFSPKKIHSISVNKLTSATKYYLTIISGSNTYLNNGIPFEITTGPSIASPSAIQNNIKGKIVQPDGSIPPEALIYLSAENSQLLSSTITKDGKFSFSLKELRADDLSSYFNVTDNTVFKIVASNGSLKSTVSASLRQTDSIPMITLSNDYDFTQKISPNTSKTVEISSGFPSIAPSKKFLKLEIISPKENQSFTDRKPQFRGTSLPNEKVEIIIHSDEQISTQVTADNNGNWTYKPPENLSPGVHTITIKTRDSAGILTTIMQSFTVFAAEITLTPTVSPVIPTQRVTPTLALIPTFPPAGGSSPIIPTLIPLPTQTPTPYPTFAPIMSKGGLPPTGNSPTLLIVGGIISTLAGFILLFFTHRAF